MLLIEKLSSLAVVFNSMAYNINSSIYNNTEQECCYCLQTNSNNIGKSHSCNLSGTRFMFLQGEQPCCSHS